MRALRPFFRSLLRLQGVIVLGATVDEQNDRVLIRVRRHGNAKPHCPKCDRMMGGERSAGGVRTAPRGPEERGEAQEGKTARQGICRPDVRRMWMKRDLWLRSIRTNPGPQRGAIPFLGGTHRRKGGSRCELDGSWQDASVLVALRFRPDATCPAPGTVSPVEHCALRHVVPVCSLGDAELLGLAENLLAFLARVVAALPPRASVVPHARPPRVELAAPPAFPGSQASSRVADDRQRHLSFRRLPACLHLAEDSRIFLMFGRVDS